MTDSLGSELRKRIPNFLLLTIVCMMAYLIYSLKLDGGVVADQNLAEPPLTEVNNQGVSHSQIEAINEMVTQHFGYSTKVVSIVKKPTNMFEVVASGNGSTKPIRMLYITPDLKNLIDGTLYTQDLRIKDLLPSHSEVTKSMVINKDKDYHILEDMEDKIKKAVLGDPSQAGNIATDAAQRTSAELRETQSSHIKALADTATTSTFSSPAIYAPGLKDKPSFMDAVTQNSGVDESATGRATLPRNNTVLDKKRVLSQIENSTWIQEGTSKKIMYIFMDFRCPACKKAHKYIEQPLANGEFTARYIPVGALGEMSSILASLSLVPDTNEKRLAQSKNFLNAASDGDILFVKPTQTELDEAKLKAVNNLKALVATKKVATPMFAFNTDEGPVITTLNKQSLMTAISVIKPEE